MKENPLSLKGYKCVISQLKKLRHKIRSWLILHIKMSSKRNIFCSVFKQTSIYQVNIFFDFLNHLKMLIYLPTVWSFDCINYERKVTLTKSFLGPLEPRACSQKLKSLTRIWLHCTVGQCRKESKVRKYWSRDVTILQSWFISCNGFSQFLHKHS